MDAAAGKTAIQVTEKAVENMKRFMAQEGQEGSHVRVGVRGGGCSGLSYVLQFEGREKIGPMDKEFDYDGVKLVVDKKSYLFLAGTTLDYEDGLAGKGFAFKNPNARQSCGCGESFSL